MNVNSRTMERLLQLQLRPRLDRFLPEETPERNETGEFADLLQTFVMQSITQSNKTGEKTQAAIFPVRPQPSVFVPGLQHNATDATVGPVPFESLINAASQRFGVAAHLIKAVIHAESSFDPLAVSSAGAKGLMQLMDRTSQSLGVADPFDPAQNIEGGTRYLSALLNKYNGQVAVALAAYNAGPGRIDRLGIATDAQLYEKYGQLPKETQSYVRKVLALQANYLS